jgi:hypothetical protein
MAQHLDPFGFTNEDQPKYETGQNLDEDGPQSKEIPFPTLDTDEGKNGPQNEDFVNVPMPSDCDERLLEEALDQQRDEMEADNTMFCQYDDAAAQEKEQPQEPLTWAAVKHWAWNGDHAQAFITDRIAETIAENIEAFGDLIVTKHYIRAVAKGVLESALTNDTPVVTLRRSGDSIIIAGKGKADLVVDVLNCANTPAKPAPMADTEERHPDDGVLGDDNDPVYLATLGQTAATLGTSADEQVRDDESKHKASWKIPPNGIPTPPPLHEVSVMAMHDNDPEGLKEWREMWEGIGKAKDPEA